MPREETALPGQIFRQQFSGNLMNYDELAFFNQQLAAMLRDGIPSKSVEAIVRRYEGWTPEL